MKVFNESNFYQNALALSECTKEKFAAVFENPGRTDSSNGNIFWIGEKAFFSVGTTYFGGEGGAESHVMIGKENTALNELSSGF